MQFVFIGPAFILLETILEGLMTCSFIDEEEKPIRTIIVNLIFFIGVITIIVVFFPLKQYIDQQVGWFAPIVIAIFTMKAPLLITKIFSFCIYVISIIFTEFSVSKILYMIIYSGIAFFLYLMGESIDLLDFGERLVTWLILMVIFSIYSFVSTIFNIDS